MFPQANINTQKLNAIVADCKLEKSQDILCFPSLLRERKF